MVEPPPPPPSPSPGFFPPPAPSPGRKPSDRGLSGLGLIMQLVGGVMTAIVSCYGFMFLIAVGLSGGRRGAGGAMMLWLLAILGTSVARSMAHKKAGDRLLHDGPGTPASALGRYFVLAAVQTGVVALAMIVEGAPSQLMIALVLMLGAWPLALLLLAKPMLAEYGDAVPMGDDKGFEGASILLLIFASIGLCIGGIMLLGWLEWPSELKSQLIGVGMLAAYVLLVIRSSLHLRAGIHGVSATHMAQTSDAVAKYAQFGVIASVVIGGILFLAMVTSMGDRAPGAAMFLMMVMVAMVTWVLLVWPLAVRRFFGDRQFSTMIDARESNRQLSPDRGLPTLGWLLLAFGSYALATGLGGLLLSDFADDGGMRRMMRGGNPLGQMMGLIGNVGDKSPWFGIGVAAVQVWAGVEMIRMSPRYKIAGIAYGALATGVALYVYMPMIKGLMRGGTELLENPLMGLMFASVAMALVVPIATLVFIRRPLHDPNALVRTFE
jgi:hypothetical protein